MRLSSCRALEGSWPTCRVEEAVVVAATAEAEEEAAEEEAEEAAVAAVEVVVVPLLLAADEADARFEKLPLRPLEDESSLASAAVGF